MGSLSNAEKEARRIAAEGSGEVDGGISNTEGTVLVPDVAGFPLPERPSQDQGFSIASEPKAGRVSLPVDEKGSPLLDRVRGKNREQWETIVHSAAFKKEFNLRPLETGESLYTCAPALAEGVLDILAQIEALVFKAGYAKENVPAEIFFRACKLDQYQKAVAVPLAQKVIGKWMPSGMSKYQDEVTLGMVLMGIVRAHSDNVKTLVLEFKGLKVQAVSSDAATVKPNGVVHDSDGMIGTEAA
jgi:hypothetical protein